MEVGERERAGGPLLPLCTRMIHTYIKLLIRQISHLSVFSMRFREWTVPVPGFLMKVPYLGRVKERCV